MVAGLEEDDILRPGAAIEWSAGDVLAHLAATEEWLAAELERAAVGDRPGAEELAAMDPRLADLEFRNAHYHELNRHRPVAEVLAWWRQADDRYQAALAALPEAGFATPQWWTGPLPLAATLDPGHALARAEAIRAWSAARR